jgi:putative addiction module component (TIGR02574 family)
MALSPEQLEEQLRHLPAPVRARLAEALIASLENADSELDVAWGDEAARRAEELRSGKVAGVPSAEAHARARAKLP